MSAVIVSTILSLVVFGFMVKSPKPEIIVGRSQRDYEMLLTIAKQEIEALRGEVALLRHELRMRGPYR